MLKTTASLFFFILSYITSDHSFLSLPSFWCSPHHPSLLDPQFFCFLSGKSRPSSEINQMAYDAIRLIYPERKVKKKYPNRNPINSCLFNTRQVVKFSICLNSLKCTKGSNLCLLTICNLYWATLKKT